MVRRLGRPVQVRLDAEGLPSAFFDGGRWRRVEQVVDLWREALPWWPGRETEEAGGRLAEALEVTMYRLLLADGGLVELERRPAEARELWRLYRVYD
ncbi:MAG: hypothetical protein IRZ11_06795 [Clostridia bacterium]|nr:hypothetical protein [Clostridia bacterium]